MHVLGAPKSTSLSLLYSGEKKFMNVMLVEWNSSSSVCMRQSTAANTEQNSVSAQLDHG